MDTSERTERLTEIRRRTSDEVVANTQEVLPLFSQEQLFRMYNEDVRFLLAEVDRLAANTAAV